MPSMMRCNIQYMADYLLDVLPTIGIDNWMAPFDGRAAECQTWPPCYPIRSHQITSPKSHTLDGRLRTMMESYKIVNCTTPEVVPIVVATCMPNKRHAYCQGHLKMPHVAPCDKMTSRASAFDLTLSINRDKKRFLIGTYKNIEPKLCLLLLYLLS